VRRRKREKERRGGEKDILFLFIYLKFYF